MRCLLDEADERTTEAVTCRCHRAKHYLKISNDASVVEEFKQEIVVTLDGGFIFRESETKSTDLATPIAKKYSNSNKPTPSAKSFD